MLKISVRTTHISAERLWDVDAPLPAPVQIHLSVTVHKLEPAGVGKAKAGFIVAASYNPPIAQISVKGVVLVQGKENEIKEAIKSSSSGKPPNQVVQAVFTSAIADAVVVSRSIGVPPPVPAPAPPKQPQGTQGSMEYTV